MTAPVWSENWTFMKMRSFATAARRSRQWVLNRQRVLDPFRFLLIAVSGWMNHRQLQVIEYLREENRVLHNSVAGECASMTIRAGEWP